MTSTSVLPSRAWWRRVYRIIRYLFSPPRFDALGAAVLVVAPDAWLRWLRGMLLAILAFVLLWLVLAGTDGDTAGAVFAVAFPAVLWVLTLVVPKRLLATFGDSEVTVEEGGIRAPRRRWTVPINSYTGLSWRYWHTEERYTERRIGEHVEVSRSSNPKIMEVHWIELVHPDPSKTLMLCLQMGEAGVRDKLGLYSRRLDRPILETRVLDDGRTT